MAVFRLAGSTGLFCLAGKNGRRRSLSAGRLEHLASANDPFGSLTSSQQSWSPRFFLLSKHLEEPVIKTHGATGPEAVAYTIKQIHTMLATDVVAQLVAHFEEMPTAKDETQS